jgi:HPr kinase/phosphorylase
MPETAVIHGTCIAFGTKGVLMLGPPGSGKSSLALRLIDEPGFGISGASKTAQLVADDQVVLHRDQGRIVASPPPALAGRLEIRGIGIAPLDFVNEAEIVLVAELVPANAIERMPEVEHRWYVLLGEQLPRVAIDAALAVAPSRLRAAFDLL